MSTPYPPSDPDFWNRVGGPLWNLPPPKYRTKHGFCVSTKWVQEQGQAECNNLDWIERQGMADEYTAKHSAKIAELVIRKAQREG